MPTYQAYKCINTTARMDCFEDWVTQTWVFLDVGMGGVPSHQTIIHPTKLIPTTTPPPPQ